MAGAAMELTDTDFEQKTGTGVALVDFWAPWCGPCKMQTPIVDRIAADYGGKAVIGTVNVDNSVKTAQAFGVSSIPTIVIIKDGQEVMRAVGVQSEASLRSAIDSALK